MEREPGQGNELIPLATFFRKQLELMEMLLIEGASSEPEPDEVLQEQLRQFAGDAKNTVLKFRLSVDGRVVELNCEMKVDDERLSL